GMWWWYPLPLKPPATTGPAAALEGEEALAKWNELSPPQFLTLAKTDKPIWVGVQAYKKNDTSRYPTPLEYRAQAYIAIIHGANRCADAVEITCSSPQIKAGSANVVSENREVKISAGALHDTFKPYEVHVYEVSQ